MGLAIAAGLFGCTADDPQITAVGAVTLYPVNPSIVRQTVTVGAEPSGNSVQTTIWKLTKAILTINGGREIDLLLVDTANPSDCLRADTPLSSPVGLGDCMDFVVLESFDDTALAQAHLELEFDIRFKRVKPPTYPLGGDFDNDGIGNATDNCVLIPNPDQTDYGGLGFGNACRVTDPFAGTAVDNDADGVVDLLDNCVHIANPYQTNPPPDVYWEIEALVSDGIGFACQDVNGSMNTTGFVEQIVDLTGQSATIDFDFVLPQAQGFVVLDFNDEAILPGCDWDAPATCTIDDTAIRACISTNGAAATLGCP